MIKTLDLIKLNTLTMNVHVSLLNKMNVSVSLLIESVKNDERRRQMDQQIAEANAERDHLHRQSQVDEAVLENRMEDFNRARTEAANKRAAIAARERARTKAAQRKGVEYET